MNPWDSDPDVDPFVPSMSNTDRDLTRRVFAFIASEDDFCDMASIAGRFNKIESAAPEIATRAFCIEGVIGLTSAADSNTPDDNQIVTEPPAGPLADAGTVTTAGERARAASPADPRTP